MFEQTANPSHGLKFIFHPEPFALTHEFCGAADIEGGGCPYCAKPLLRIVSLNSNDSQLNLDPTKVPAVRLLYCWTCSIPYAMFSYRITPRGSVEIIDLPPV